jgi:hypothetical protein
MRVQKIASILEGYKRGGDSAYRFAEIHLAGGFRTTAALDWGSKLA